MGFPGKPTAHMPINIDECGQSQYGGGFRHKKGKAKPHILVHITFLKTNYY